MVLVTSTWPSLIFDDVDVDMHNGNKLVLEEHCKLSENPSGARAGEKRREKRERKEERKEREKRKK